MTTRADIVAAARECLGTPWKHLGRKVGPREGIDCIGILTHVGRKLRLTFHDRTDYSLKPDGHTLLEELDASLVRLTGAELQMGQVVAFVSRRTNGRRGRVPAHVGIITDWANGGLGLIHTYGDVDECVESNLDDWWAPLVCAQYDYPGVED